MSENLFILIGFNKNRYTEELISSKSSYSHCIERVKKHFDKTLVLVKPGTVFDQTFDLPKLEIENEDVFNSFSKILEKYPDYENYIFADLYSPFLEAELGKKFSEINNQEAAHYTYGEHFPRGITPQVLSKEAMTILRNVASGNNLPFNDEAIFDLMGININNYDIEIEVSHIDFRHYRLDLKSRTFMQNAQIKKIIEKIKDPLQDINYDTLSKILVENHSIFRTVPAYIEIDLSQNCNLSCSFCPREAMSLGSVENGKRMSMDDAVSLAAEIKKINPEAVISFSPYCEPMEHPDFEKILTAYINEGFKIVLETNGTFITQEKASVLSSFPDEKLIVIVSLDVLNKDDYIKYKKKDLFESVIDGIKTLMDLKKRNVLIQVLNMKELSETVDSFYDFWKDNQDNILPRKYNSFSGQLPDKNAVDLSPLNRFPCWHIKRDMVIHYNGETGLCKQDINLSEKAGNVFNDNIETVWNKLADSYETHIKDKNGSFQLCKNCDEWYTYNF